jgi:hypothetical protein
VELPARRLERTARSVDLLLDETRGVRAHARRLLSNADFGSLKRGPT